MRCWNASARCRTCKECASVRWLVLNQLPRRPNTSCHTVIQEHESLQIDHHPSVLEPLGSDRAFTKPGMTSPLGRCDFGHTSRYLEQNIACCFPPEPLFVTEVARTAERRVLLSHGDPRLGVQSLRMG